jgi:tRNA threonylcarbamoyladenosine biosynthesis protein TsaB
LKILALDTSTEYCSVALRINAETDVREIRAGQRHSELVLGMIDELLSGRRLRARDLDGIAYGEGPGSFTGLRIACGVVQGVAFGANVRVAGVGTLLAMAEGSGADRVVCCVDARVHEIYHAAYCRVAPGERTGETQGFPRNLLPSVCGWTWRVVHPPSVCAPAAAPELPGEGWLACGSGFRAYGDVLEKRYAGRLSGVDLALYPHARDIAALALPAFETGSAMPAEAAAPVYLRDKVALRIDERPNR